MRALTSILLALSAILSTTSCVGPTLIVQQYDGPARPSYTVAVLRLNGRDPVQLLTVDGGDAAAQIARDTRIHVELLPGPHSVTVVNPGNRDQRGTVDFIAEAGRVYRPMFVGLPRREGAIARVFEVGRSDDIALRDVSLDLAQDAGPSKRPAADGARPDAAPAEWPTAPAPAPAPHDAPFIPSGGPLDSGALTRP